MHFQYCPYCGNKTADRELGDEGMVPYCEKCDIPLFDMFSTGIITAVVNEYGEVALLRQDYVSTVNHVCVAGYIKVGESAEETVIREVKEELGLDAEKIEFIRSYPYDKKQMLMLGYKTSVKKKEFALSCEVDSAEWVKLSDAPALLREGGIAWQLVKEIYEPAGA
ncbi:MAG: NUDIX domain-containing protein [Lachnospiraceae bacterium]|nr:NUDIX domain-containing protein [Lachnospiraceae bacterium]